MSTAAETLQLAPTTGRPPAPRSVVGSVQQTGERERANDARTHQARAVRGLGIQRQVTGILTDGRARGELLRWEMVTLTFTRPAPGIAVGPDVTVRACA